VNYIINGQTGLKSGDRCFTNWLQHRANMQISVPHIYIIILLILYIIYKHFFCLYINGAYTQNETHKKREEKDI